jgi:hypothetical protein
MTALKKYECSDMIVLMDEEKRKRKVEKKVFVKE